VSDVVDVILDRFAAYGGETYLGEPVTLSEHMLQTAQTAEREGAPPALVAAAFLHDYGHLIHDLPADSAEHGVDTRHEEVGFAFLQRHFPPEIVEPVRLHVDAKRYLCAVDPAYIEQLSEASRLSLSLQGGPMNADEVAAFERSPHAEAAALLRRFDDVAKLVGAQTPPAEHYRPLLERFVC
jgi:[1-hydroxy-2-(trimethylamino)ethyl]phosphonate dioxygenase